MYKGLDNPLITSNINMLRNTAVTLHLLYAYSEDRKFIHMIRSIQSEMRPSDCL
jgi:hypothetical protein